MKTIRPYKLIAVIFAAALAICSCSTKNGNKINVENDDTGDGMTITDISFKNQYNDIAVRFRITSDTIVNFQDDDNNFKGIVNDRVAGVNPLRNDKYKPAKSIKFLGTEFFNENDINIYGLVDLSMSEEDLDKTRTCLKGLMNHSGEGHIFLTLFTSKDKMSGIIPATDYVLDNYVCKKSKLLPDNDTATNIYLYRDVTKCLDKLINSDTHTHLDTAKLVSVVVFSNENTFDKNDYPIDPKHFKMQERMMGLLDKIPAKISIYHVSEKAQKQKNSKGSEPSMMNVLCEKTRGAFVDEISANNISKRILAPLGFDIPDYELTVDNTRGLLYYGKSRMLTVKIINSDGNVVMSASKRYRIGNMSNIIPVGNVSLSLVVFSVIFKTLIVALVLYLILQFVVPFIRYIIFRNKYVVKYKGNGQYVNSVVVPQNCYYCKAPFEPDEEIVVKCQHVVHESCWDENDHHCPEHGLNCRTGSHFYDKEHPFNIKNAPYFTTWILMVISATIIHLSISSLPSAIPTSTIDNITNFIVDSTQRINHDDLLVLSLRNYFQPYMFFGFAFCITLMLSLLSTHRRKTIFKLLDTITRSFIAGILSMIVFVIQSLFIVVMGLQDVPFLVEWIPSILLILIIEYSVTIKSIAKCRHKRFLITAVILGFLQPIANHFFNYQDTIYELGNTMFIRIITAIIIAVVVADKLPRRQKSFLHVSGSIKDFDVALYKWFSQCAHANVTIGKSVDCSLHIFWDMDKDIAPVHASIRMVNGVHRLFINDNDVEFNGKKAKHNKSYELHYGDVFKIGKTKFKYLGI